jgi:hypothetical protein
MTLSDRITRALADRFRNQQGETLPDQADGVVIPRDAAHVAWRCIEYAMHDSAYVPDPSSPEVRAFDAFETALRLSANPSLPHGAPHSDHNTNA